MVIEVGCRIQDVVIVDTEDNIDVAFFSFLECQIVHEELIRVSLRLTTELYRPATEPCRQYKAIPGRLE